MKINQMLYDDPEEKQPIIPTISARPQGAQVKKTYKMKTKFIEEANKENQFENEIDLKKIREIAKRNKSMMHEQMEADYSKEEKAIERKKRKMYEKMAKNYTKSKSEKKLALIKKLKIDIGPARDKDGCSDSSCSSDSDDGSQLSDGDSAYLDDISLNTIQEIYQGVRPESASSRQKPEKPKREKKQQKPLEKIDHEEIERELQEGEYQMYFLNVDVKNTNEKVLTFKKWPCT